MDQFLELLHSGGNDYPIELIKKAGDDMTTPGAILQVIRNLRSCISDL